MLWHKDADAPFAEKELYFTEMGDAVVQRCCSTKMQMHIEKTNCILKKLAMPQYKDADATFGEKNCILKKQVMM